ncbi:TPA: fluoride efflux transporter CrcB [Klebsiella pneumoniae]|uniref:Fluoride-specific ion channel FluC n=3 Tax=Klebsiella TaxID=570 RepID=A0A4P0XIQ6_KLEPN|nr:MULTISPECIES: fluoride efflux transporter CrcB [Enterobacteriaceae]ELA0208715.1 fluoride efflux transporter CrcB [Klebsiella aerogenes]ELE9734909.1 fluoride efflux transporter CrcB [Enterobacter kobei]HBL6845781.1 fluoride efflux transporter CrcB [Klebsiella oxytoca]HBZ8009515.1 fluoride efflux transporter CrcB [Klebsiella variicola subsp. variicola]HDU3534913.1 fluoride efflux transporter CrcB [Klebsiella pneumoniae subsp. ozaenae]
MYKSLFAVVIGGSIGCAIRWILSMRLNALFPNLPPGTLVVNLMGGFIIGMALAFFVRQPNLDPAWKFFLTTGLCGGMTTFSTFSAEVVALLQNGNYAWAVISVLTHVTGSLLMTAAGFFVMTLF